jgi:NAD(P)-dependent dehydrogenase (short-subunit alcohol dehydrogenase family)
MNTKRFSGKVVLVTGATSGIGKTTAIEFARAGAKVVLTGRREKEGAQVVAEIKKLGGEAALSGQAHWIRPPRRNTGASSTSTFGAF